MDGDEVEEDEMGGGVCAGGKHRLPYLIRLTALLGEYFASSSLLSHEGEIKGLVSNSSLLPFLQIFPLRIVPNINVFA